MFVIKKKHTKYFYPVLANGIPKSGTHLLENFLKVALKMQKKASGHYYSYRDEGNSFDLLELKGALNNLKGNEFLLGHFTFSPEFEEVILNCDIKSILIIRDPRDIVVSHINHALKLQNYRLHFLYKKLSQEDQLDLTIKGVDDSLSPNSIGNPNIRDRFNGFKEWMNKPYNLTIRYEDLIGPKGGGNDEKQKEATDLLLRHICLHTDKVKVSRDKIFDTRSVTFNKGQIGQWKEVFTKKNIDNFKAIAGNMLIELGYEEDLNW